MCNAGTVNRCSPWTRSTRLSHPPPRLTHPSMPTLVPAAALELELQPPPRVELQPPQADPVVLEVLLV